MIRAGRFANDVVERVVGRGSWPARPAPSASWALVRGAQSGFIRAYALLVLGGFAALALYFLVVSSWTGRRPGAEPAALDAARRRAARRACRPGGLPGPLSAAGSLVTLGLAAAVVRDFDTATPGLQHVVDESWIPDLGVRYQLGVDGISLFLVAMTALLWAGELPCSAFRLPDRPKNYFLMLGVAETATLGAFLAQDLLLFVLFFDLMLVPFFFLIGS